MYITFLCGLLLKGRKDSTRNIIEITTRNNLVYLLFIFTVHVFCLLVFSFCVSFSWEHPAYLVSLGQNDCNVVY